MQTTPAPEAKTKPWGEVAIVILLNIVPLIGVTFWGWSVFALVFLYWIENLVIGLRTLLSMAATGLVGGGLNLVGFVVIGAFFTVHYGLFCFVHGTFVVALFGDGQDGDSIFGLADTARDLFAAQPGLLAGLASIVIWQSVQFVLFIVRGEVRRTNPLQLMAQPYPRIIVLHLTIIGGGFLVMALQQPAAGLVAMVLLKTAFDIAETLKLTPALFQSKDATSSNPS